MLVSCSACSAKFQLPDEKIAGRKARMKCKNCGELIAIDGTAVRVSAAPKAPPPPSRQASKPRHEAPSYSDHTVAISAQEAEALTRQSREAETEAAPEIEDRITPISSPLAAEHLLDQGYVDAAMDALEQKIFSVPAPRPAPKPPTAPPLPKVAPADDEEATRMMDLPRLLSGAPVGGASVGGASVSGAPFGKAPGSGVLAVEGESEEATQMLDLQGALGLAGASSGSASADEPTRIFDADPAPRAPRLPPRPSLPRPPGAAAASVSTPPDSTAPDSIAPHLTPADVDSPADLSASLSDPTPFDVPDVEPPPAAPTGPLLSGGLSAGAPAAAGSLPPRGERAPGDLTVQRARLSSLPPRPSGKNWGIYLFLLALAATGSLTGVYFFARPTFESAITGARQTLGLGAPGGQAAGPAFDAAAAARELARVAALAPTCKQPTGPTGAGRARVLFQMSGTASSAAVSAPFHASGSEACLLGLFKSARVPAFGGQAVIVTKTFRVD